MHDRKRQADPEARARRNARRQERHRLNPEKQRAYGRQRLQRSAALRAERAAAAKAWREANPERYKASLRAWRAKNHHRARELSWRNQGIHITWDEFERRLIDQAGRCGICARTLQNPQVDHCHETGKIRGILCMPCNRILSVFGDNLSGVMRAVRYLEDAA